MKQYDLVYINGDSYSAHLNSVDVYGKHIAEYFNAEYVNSAIQNSCNSRIFRTALRDLYDLKSKKSNILACVSLSFLFRTELWDIGHTFTDFRNSNDGDFFSLQPFTQHGWKEHIKSLVGIQNTSNTNVYTDFHQQYAKQYAVYYDVEAETVKLIEKILLFANWCENNNIEYIIFSPMYQEKIDFSAPFVSSFYIEIEQNKNILNPFEFSALEWCLERNHLPMDNYQSIVNNKKYQVGHMGASGHRALADYLIKNYLNN